VSSSSKTEQARGIRGDRLIEIIAVAMLGIATLGSAWCAFQASQWNGKESDYAREGTDARVEASRQFGLATQKVAYDASIVAQYAQAFIEGNEKLATFYRTTLFRPDFLPVVERWEAAVKAGGAPPTNLFQDPGYLNAEFADYQKAEAVANDNSEKVDEAGALGDEYVLTTLLLASAMFFAGVTTSFRLRVPRLLLLSAAGLTIAYAASRLVTLDVA
jgi:hypothetical protein